MSHQVDHDVNRFLERLIGSAGTVSNTAIREALDHLLSVRKDIKISITSPESTANDDINRVQELRSLEVSDEVIRTYIAESASSLDSNDKDQYVDLVMERATTLTNKQNGKVSTRSFNKTRDIQVVQEHDSGLIL